MRMMTPVLERSICACVASAITLTLVPGPADAGSPGPASRRGQGPHVRVELIVDRNAPGAGMSLGVKFELDPNWHIYWQNPGNSGGPPRVTWKLPAGVTVSGIEWPVPERIDAGGVFDYGYHNGTVLPVRVSGAGGAFARAGFVIGASVRWMVCHDLCVPGQAELEIAFPLTPQERAQVAGWAAAIAAARRLVPKPAPPAWKVSARATSGTFIIDVVTGSREEQAVFFPLEAGQVNDSADQRVAALPRGLRLVLRKSDQLKRDPAVLAGVLSLSGSRAFVVSAKVGGQ
jgi:thiol:disulfide interchange protein DsbD